MLDRLVLREYFLSKHESLEAHSNEISFSATSVVLTSDMYLFHICQRLKLFEVWINVLFTVEFKAASMDRIDFRSAHNTAAFLRDLRDRSGWQM